MGRKITRHPVYAIVYFLFFLFITVPVLNVFGYTLFSFDTTIENLKLIDKSLFLLLAKSTVISFVVALISTLLGLIFGFLLYKTNIKYSSIFKIGILIPLFISPYILAVAWKDILSYFSQEFMNTYPIIGVLLVLTIIYTPLSILIIGSAFSNVSKQVEESGLMITSIKKVFIKILLPLIKPALVSSFVLVFIFSISEFSVPSYFGVQVFTTEIFTQFSAFYNHSLAIIQSILLVILCVLLLFSERKSISDSSFLSINGRGKSTRIYDLGKRSTIIISFLLSSIIISIGFPIIMLIKESFKTGATSFKQAIHLLLPTIENSIFLASIGSLLAIFIGFVAAYFSERYRKKHFDWLLLFIFAIPSIVFGISLIKFYNSPILNFIYSSFGIIIIGYIGKYSFISSKLIGNAIKQVPKSLDEVAITQGVSSIKRIWNILLPLILPAVFASFIINFLLCFGDLGMTIMVYPPGTEILPIKVFTIMANAPQSLTSSMALIVLLLTLLIITILFFTFRKIMKNYNVINS